MRAEQFQKSQIGISTFNFYSTSSSLILQHNVTISLARWVALGTTQLLYHLFSVTLWLTSRVTHVLPTTPSEIQDNCISQHLYCRVKTLSGLKLIRFLPIFQDSQQSLASAGVNMVFPSFHVYPEVTAVDLQSWQIAKSFIPPQLSGHGHCRKWMGKYPLL